jgi:pyruvate formate lyase activating enzyme
MKEAMLWDPLNNNRVRCNLCAHYCVIRDGGAGICKVRVNKGGKLFTLVYGNLVAESVDPIEKKPLFHFLPGSFSYSIATAGCNFACPFCQNYHISMFPKEGGFLDIKETPPENVVSSAISSGCRSISYTYTEPTVFFEFALDTSKKARKKGLKNNFITNGYISKEALKIISPYLDAADVDLKGDENFYRKLCKARQGPVIDNISRMKEMGIWVEVTTLLIPEYNDSEEQVKAIAKIIKGIDPGIPWHISRFYPAYKMSEHYPTPVDSIVKAREVGLAEGLRYVYMGNVPGNDGEYTYCPSCGRVLIKRYGYTIMENHVKDGRCAFCGAEIDGVFDKG